MNNEKTLETDGPLDTASTGAPDANRSEHAGRSFATHVGLGGDTHPTDSGDVDEASSSRVLPPAPRPKSRRGFAAMDPAVVREIASKGGKAAHAAGTAHEFNSEEARLAGRKGGQAAHRSH